MAGVAAGVTAGLSDVASAASKAGGALGAAGKFLGGAGIASVVARAAIGNAVSQGIGVATRLQPRFDFAGVAAAGAGAFAGARFGGSGLGGRINSIGADALASAGTRSVLTGTDFGDNLLAVLPDVVARTLGAVAEDVIAGRGRSDGGFFSQAPEQVNELATSGGGVQAELAALVATGGPSLSASSGNAASVDQGDAEIVVTATKRAWAEARASFGSTQRLSFMGAPFPGSTAPFTVAPPVASTTAAPPLPGVTAKDVARLLGRRALGAASLLVATNSDLDLSIPLNGTDFMIGGKANTTSRYLLDMAGNEINSLEIVGDSLYRVLQSNGSPGMFADYTGIGGANAIVITMGTDGAQRGFGISVQDQAEMDIAREARVRGLDAYEIQNEINAYRGGGGSIAADIGAAETNIWKLGAGPRGEALEKIFGHNLPGNMPVIDRFENGIATSIKSIDLDGASYLTGNGLKNTLTRYVDKVAGYQGTGAKGWAGVIIREKQITGRGLDLIVPHGGSAAQQQVLADIVKYGASKPNPVRVNVIPYP